MRLDVAALVAEGLTDKDIAAQLHISRKTVEYHIGRLCDEWHLDRRLNLRVQITRRLLSPGDVPVVPPAYWRRASAG